MYCSSIACPSSSPYNTQHMIWSSYYSYVQVYIYADYTEGWTLARESPRVCFKMAEKTPNYDSDVAAIVVDANCSKLVQSMDPVSSAPKLVSFGLISSQQAQDILDDRVKTKSERNLAFLNLIKSSPDPTWFSSLLEVLGEERITEGLKEVLEKSELLVVKWAVAIATVPYLLV